MNISDIHFHDTEIHRVTEDLASDTLTFEVMYPINWKQNLFEPYQLIFSDSYNYQVFEQSASGLSTILEAKVVSTTERWTRIRLETNLGYRELSFVSVKLVPRPAV